MPEAVGSSLERVLQETIAAIERGREEIYDIAEGARAERDRVQSQLQQVQSDTCTVIDQVDQTQLELKKARLNLMRVSRDFRRFGEDDIRRAYEEASDLQVRLALLEERERQLRVKRDELQRSLKNLENTTAKAEKLVSQVGVAMSYLASNLGDIQAEVERARQVQEEAFVTLHVLEEERRRLARNMHDGPAQGLANLVLGLEYAQRLLEVKPGEVAEQVARLKDQARANLNELRKTIYDLRPVYLGDLGLAASLARLAEDFRQRSGLEVAYTQEGSAGHYHSAQETAVFRVVQEALNNVAKHAAARRVELTLSCGSGEVRAVISDDGRGFDPSAPGSSGEEGLGLRGMAERARLAGGTLAIKSRPGEGTSIELAIPVERWGSSADPAHGG